MMVPCRWPTLIPAIRRAGHEPVLCQPLEYPPGPAPTFTQDAHGNTLVAHPAAPPVRIHPNGRVEVLEP